MDGSEPTDLEKIDDSIKALFEWILDASNNADDEPDDSIVAVEVVNKLPKDQKELFFQYMEAKQQSASVVSKTNVGEEQGLKKRRFSC